ncbi:MAG: NERD domain-containing protein, partial [Desulfatiglandales bacterium]|nr:NERD domain-containing protein [Desulfatiglandales bacterium]
MAKIYPSRPDSGIPASERKVFEQLAKELPGNWVVIHARRLVLHSRNSSHIEEGEVDFLVLDPERGYLGLEVKGGAIGRDADGWYSTDRHGQKHKIRDPGSQAQRAVRMVRDYLGDRNFFQKYRIGYGWGVIFPDIEVPDHLDAAL